jgi:hypothetical protein
VFQFFLARTVTRSTVAELQSRLSHSEMVEWAAYFEIEPWGESVYGAREDVRHAARCSLMVNTAFGARGTARLTDFLPRWNEKTKPMNPADVKARFRAYANATNRKL